MNRAAVLLPATLFAASFAVFLWSPNHQMTDSGYALLTTENLIRHGDLDLARYRLDHGPGSNYRLEHVGERTVYFFPVASSILSVPYLALDRLLGRPIVDPDGAYATRVEEAAEARLAALLMAAFTVIVFLTARLLLPAGTGPPRRARRRLWHPGLQHRLADALVGQLGAGARRRRRLSPPAIGRARRRPPSRLAGDAGVVGVLREARPTASRWWGPRSSC